MDDLIQEFLTETTESLNALDSDIVKLEQNPNDKDLIGRIFRLVHTVKGTCGFLGLPRLEKVAHHSENIMGRYREGSLQVTEAGVSLILESFDRIKSIVAGIAATEKEPEGDDSALIAKLDAVFEGKEIAAPAAAAPKVEEKKPEEKGSARRANANACAGTRQKRCCCSSGPGSCRRRPACGGGRQDAARQRGRA
jgi:two-component system chemotaxis sensor kinase CheA